MASTASATAKRLGQYYTPEAVAGSLVRAAVRGPSDRVLDPSCGDGQFLRQHKNSVGIEVSGEVCQSARFLAPEATVIRGDFFQWAEETEDRFDAVVGNPPFIRYQNFTGETRRRALRLAKRVGAQLTGLTSSWVPFVAASSALLVPGGCLAFVVPAEIGHAPYAAPLIEALCSRFERVQIIAVREKIFPDLSEDAWLLLARGCGGRTESIALTIWESFRSFKGFPRASKRIALSAWKASGCRLRKFLLPRRVLAYYQQLAEGLQCRRLGELARVGIGYVTGANDFFHLRPSEAEARGIPRDCLVPSIRKGEQLPDGAVTPSDVAGWLAADLPVLFLHLRGRGVLPPEVSAYLDSPAGRKARRTYKCRHRTPWYAVPDVVVPDAFLSYMSGDRPVLAWNEAGCVCSNSIHAVRFNEPQPRAQILEAWGHPFCELSRELEGHPLGGGMLKMEPGEARRVLLPLSHEVRRAADLELIRTGIATARTWRHYGNGASR